MSSRRRGRETTSLSTFWIPVNVISWLSSGALETLRFDRITLTVVFTPPPSSLFLLFHFICGWADLGRRWYFWEMAWGLRWQQTRGAAWLTLGVLKSRPASGYAVALMDAVQQTYAWSHIHICWEGVQVIWQDYQQVCLLPLPPPPLSSPPSVIFPL